MIRDTPCCVRVGLRLDVLAEVCCAVGTCALVFVHFDGVRVDAQTIDAVSDFIARSVARIKEEATFDVEIIEKTHFVLLERIADTKQQSSTHVTSDIANLFMLGNCICLALWRLRRLIDTPVLNRTQDCQLWSCCVCVPFASFVCSNLATMQARVGRRSDRVPCVERRCRHLLRRLLKSVTWLDCLAFASLMSDNRARRRPRDTQLCSHVNDTRVARHTGLSGTK